MHGERESGGDQEGSAEGLVARQRPRRIRLLIGALAVCTLAATAGCSQSGNASGPEGNGGVSVDASAESAPARDWAAVEDGLDRELDDETRAAVEEASRGDAGAQGSVAPDTIRAGS